MKVISGGITKPVGFQANGMSCGIKKSGKPDLALIYCDVPATSASLFTKNSIKAAPLVVSQQRARNNIVQAIIINSGNANCFTGNFGFLYAKKSTELVARLLDIENEQVLVASTGIIGVTLPYNKIEAATPALVKGLSHNGGNKAAQAILTTDKATKEIAVEITLNGKKIVIAGCAKGSGMIQPNMATMLAFITTDAAISPKLLKHALQEAAEISFNSITVDGCMSTNDMVTVMASGLAKNRVIANKGVDYHKFLEALKFVCLDLAKKIVLDAEGGTKFIEVNVVGAASVGQAKKACFAIANSNLFKTAAFGSDPNWGRVAAAIGSLGLPVEEKDLKIKFSPFTQKNINITVELNLGKYRAKVYTADLSIDYVRINGKYN